MVFLIVISFCFFVLCVFSKYYVNVVFIFDFETRLYAYERQQRAIKFYTFNLNK